MLVLPAAQRAELEAWIRAGYPHETCGLLIGRKEELGGEVRAEVRRVAHARNRNVERANDRYELDPEDFLRADENARAERLEIVGVWHSHPDHPAEPSETDRAAAWEGWSYLIASVSEAGVTAVRSWRLAGQRFVEEPLTS
jgi:proteasome lid subunit RPN8/RPN11